jgi:predicted trehalose synthase
MVDGQATFVGFGERAEDRSSPLKDVASITRSFEVLGRETIAGAEHDVTADAAHTADVTETVTSRAHSAFLERYAERTRDLVTVPRDAEQRDALLHFFRLRGALRDVSDAAARRPELLAAAVAALEYEC